MRIFAALSTMLLATAAAAQAPSAAPSQASGDSGGLVCRTTGETGSRLSRTRTCKSRAAWDAERREQRDMVDRAQTRQINRVIDERTPAN